MEANEIIDSENYRGTNTYGFKDICLRQVQKVVNIYSKEMTKGFWKKTLPNSYGTQEVLAYIPDGRLGYIQAVECLHDLLLPKFDKTIKEEAEAIEKDIDTKHNEILELSKQGKKVTNDDWYKEKIKYMRKMFQRLCLFLERLGWLEDDTEGEE